MNVNKNTPDIRFSGFGGNWDKKKLAELVQPVSSYPLSRGVEVNEDTKYRYIHYGDIHRGKLKVIKSEKQLSNIHMGNYELLEKGDLVVADASEDYEGIANPCVLDYELQDKVVAGLHTIAMRPINTDPLYLYNLFHTDLFKSHGRFIGTGTKVFGISAKNLLRFESFVPELNEQAAIGSFFQHIDETIALSRRKHEKTKTLKNAFLSKMFPQTGKNQPEIRLKGFSGDWVKKMLVDEVDFFTGLTYSPSDVTDKAGTLVLRSSNVQGGDISLKDNVYVSSEVVNSQNVEPGDVIVVVRNGSRNLIGKHAMIKEPMANTVIGAFMTGIRAPTPSFLNALLDTQQFSDEISKNLGATINQITGGMFKSMEFYFPQAEEQIAIGQSFKKIDDTLALQAKQLKTLESFKKALLAKMFV